MAVKSVSEFVYGVFFAVADIACHNADDIRIGDTVFLVDAVIAEYNIIAAAHFDNAVEDIAAGRSAIEDHIIFSAALIGLFTDGKKVLALS